MFIIRQLATNDFSEIERIYLQTFPRTDDADFVAAWRTKECNYSLGLFHKATLVGFAITCLEAFADASREDRAFADASREDRVFADAGPEVAHLWFIAIDPTQRSAGAGTQLLTALIDACLADGLRLILTPDNNPRVIDWYKRHNFVITKTMPFVHVDIPMYWMEWLGDDSASVPAKSLTTTLSTESLRGSPISRGSFSSDCSVLELENTDG
jgi:ribosomal protein S18 acetylase RimI-like enzyme